MITLVFVLVVVLLFGSVGMINAQDDECFFGSGSWKELMDDNPDVPEFKEKYKDSVRSDEIREYIEDNLDEFGVQDWQDDIKILCGIADDVVEKENKLGKTFSGNELDGNIELSVISNGIDTFERYHSTNINQ